MQESIATAPETTSKHEPLVERQNNTSVLADYRKRCDEGKLPFVVARDFVMQGYGKTAKVELDMFSTGQCLKRNVIEQLFEQLSALSVLGATIRASQASIRSTAVHEDNAWSVALLLLDAAMLEENRIDASPNDGQMRNERVGVVELGGSVKITKL